MSLIRPRVNGRARPDVNLRPRRALSGSSWQHSVVSSAESAPPQTTGLTLTNDVQRSRYEATLNGEVVAFADYEIRGEIVVMPHTVTMPVRRGNGYAAQVVRYALDDIRAAGRTVVASCWYVAKFIDEHPDDADLLA
jgi:predicted GNAT family acetyltransferase